MRRRTILASQTAATAADDDDGDDEQRERRFLPLMSISSSSHRDRDLNLFLCLRFVPIHSNAWVCRLGFQIGGIWGVWLNMDEGGSLVVRGWLFVLASTFGRKVLEAIQVGDQILCSV